jgi:hypothetical protein
MAVVKSVSAVTATWTASQLASAFESAFVGAGLMSAWFDSFAGSEFEHRILEVTYDATKAYGKTYYWFIFDASSASVATCSGWDTGNKRPRGIGVTDGLANLDWAGNSAAAVAATTKSLHYQILSLSNTTSCSLTRYTSSGRSFFTLRSGTLWNTFTIDQAAVSLRSWYNAAFAGAYHNGFWTVSPDISNLLGINFVNRLSTRRAAFGGSGYANGNSTQRNYMTGFSFQDIYENVNAAGGFRDGMIAMPHWTTANNSALPANFTPVFTGIRPGAIYASDLPADFGITALRGASANTIAIQDAVIAVAGSEEYEILSGQPRGVSGEANNLFVARTVG